MQQVESYRLSVRVACVHLPLALLSPEGADECAQASVHVLEASKTFRVGKQAT